MGTNVPSGIAIAKRKNIPAFLAKLRHFLCKWELRVPTSRWAYENASRISVFETATPRGERKSSENTVQPEKELTRWADRPSLCLTPFACVEDHFLSFALPGKHLIGTILPTWFDQLFEWAFSGCFEENEAQAWRNSQRSQIKQWSERDKLVLQKRLH